MDKNFSIDMLLQSSGLPQPKEHPHKGHDSPAPSRSGCSSESATYSNAETFPAASSTNGPLHSPQWYDSINYINLTQQLAAQMIHASHSGPSLPAQMAPPSAHRNLHGIWDPCISWLYPYMQKTQQKRKGGQIRFTNEQTDALEHKFDSHKYLSPQERKKLAKSLSLSERQKISFNDKEGARLRADLRKKLFCLPPYSLRTHYEYLLDEDRAKVKTWFQNRRAKWRRVRKDGDDDEDNSADRSSDPRRSVGQSSQNSYYFQTRI